MRQGKKYGASGTMLPMIRGTVWRNLERRSGRMAAGCAKVNGITHERLADNAGHPQVFPFRDEVQSSLAPIRWGSPDAAVVLLAIHAGALVALAALNATLFTGANMSVRRRIGFLAIDMG